MPINPQARISPAEAERAVYIDFEGFEGHAPTLIGVLIEDDFEQIVFDPVLQSAADAKGRRVSPLRVEALRLTGRCAAERRRLVAYSQHERTLLMAHAQVDVADWYGDARMLAKRWKNRVHPDAELGGWALKDFLQFIGHPRGDYLGHRRSTRRIKAVRDMLARRGSFEALTPVKKAQWTKLLEHNEIDCRGMRALVIRASQELA